MRHYKDPIGSLLTNQYFMVHVTMVGFDAHLDPALQR